MTELEKLVEATIAPYLKGDTLSPESATVAANALKVAMQDRGYSVVERAKYLGGFVKALLSDPTTRTWRDAAIRAMGEGFGFDVSVSASPDEKQFSMTLAPRPVQ